MGESMGGLNALLAGLQAKQQFSQIISLCPPRYLISPYSAISDIKNFISRTGMDQKIAAGLFSIGRSYYSSLEEWEQNSPIAILKIYLSCGLLAKYRNFESPNACANLAQDVIGLAIAVIIGGKLNDLIGSLVNDLLTPLLFAPALRAANVDDIRKLFD